MAGSHSLIRTLYLYLFALIGLVLVTIGAVGFLNMGLRAFIFTHADSQERYFREMPPRPFPLENGVRLLEAEELSPEERSRLRGYLNQMEAWDAGRKDVDPITAQRHRNASQNLAMMLIGIPLYLYHWKVIRGETAREPIES